MSGRHRLAIVDMQGTPNIPGLTSYVAPIEQPPPKPAVSLANWVAVFVMGFAAAYLLSHAAKDEPFQDWYEEDYGDE